MTNDELLAGFLDRSLSEDLLVELEARRAADPTFDQDVREMVAVEDVLLTAAPVTVIPTDVLAKIEDAIAARVSTGASHTPAGIASTLKTFGLAIAAVGTAVGVYVATQRTETPHPIVHQAAPAAPVSTVISTPTPTVAPSPAPVSTSTPAPSIASAADEQPSGDGSANAYVSSSTPVIDRLLSQYASCKQRNDNMRCAQLALNIGQLYRKRADYQSAMTFFNEALSAARTLRVVEYEVEALGSIGLINLDRGNASAARTFLRSAIERAEGVDGVTVDRYRQALSGLE